MKSEEVKFDVDLLEELLKAGETGDIMLGVDYPDSRMCKFWGLPQY